MKARPSKRHYCDQCDDTMSGHLREEPTPTFKIGCCFNLEWSGTREDAGSLYDYLEDAGYLKPGEVCKDGCYIPDGSDSYNMDGWECGACHEFFNNDDYEDAKAAAVACCMDREGVDA